MSSYVKETDLEIILLRFKADIVEAIDSKIDKLEGKIDRLDTKLSNRIFQLYVLVTAVGMGVVGALYWILKGAGLV